MEPQDVIRHSGPLPLIRVKGSHREIGRQIGESCARQVKHCIENARILIGETYASLQLTWDGAHIQARKYLPFIQERYPKYVDEMLGLSEGAGVPFDDIVVLTSMEAVTMDALHLGKCTSLAVNEECTADGHVLVAHNEDWDPRDEPDVYLVHAEPNDEPPFLAMGYGGYLSNVGFNAYGIAQCCDSVYPDDSRIGIPRIIVARAVLAARRPEEAIRSALVPQRAAGYNHLIAHESGEMYNVEVSARQFAILYAKDGRIAHTNYYLDTNMRQVEHEPDELVDKRVRYLRAWRLLNDICPHSIKTLQAIQRDHVNRPNSICNHDDTHPNPFDREKTICSLVMDLTARTMAVAWGNPCVNAYYPFFLDA
jgi:isopenicillin-N N-acyltransferase-like protein